MSVRVLLVFALLAAPATALAAGPSLPPSPRMPGQHEETIEAGAQSVVRVVGNGAIAITDPAGDGSHDVVLFNEPITPPSGSTYSFRFPKWFIDGHLDLPAYAFAQLDYEDFIGAEWHGGSLFLEDPAGDEDPPRHLVRASIESMGNDYVLQFTSSTPAPGGNNYFGYSFDVYDLPVEVYIAGASAINYTNFGFQEQIGYAGTPFNPYRTQYDVVSGTLNQLDAHHLEIELMMGANLPSIASPPLQEGLIFIPFYDREMQYTERYAQFQLTPQGWSGTLRMPGGWDGMEVAPLTNVSVSGNRVRGRIPLDAIPVREEVAFLVHTSVGILAQNKVYFSTQIDRAPNTGFATLSLTNPAEVAVSAFPGPLVQVANQGGATTSFTLTNVGDEATTITLTREGDFFNLEPAVFVLQPGASQRVVVTGLAKAAGNYSGAAVVSGLGVPAGLRIPIRMLVAAPPAEGEAEARAESNRVDVAAPAEQQQVPGDTAFTNVGDGTLTGILVADVPWLTFTNPVITIAPAQTVRIPFVIDRAKRTDGDNPLGSAIGSLSLNYLSGSGSAALAALKEAMGGSVPVSKTLVTVTDTAKPAISTAAPARLEAGEVAVFLSGVGNVASSVGTFISDLYLASLQPLTNLSMFHTPAGFPLSQSTRTILGSLSSLEPIAFADLTRTVFDQASGLGTLQIRGANVASLDVSAAVFNKSNPAGTYGSAIPALRSDRSIGPGERMFISGLVGFSATGRTNMIVQEVTGSDATITVDLLDATGAVVASSPQSVPAFQHIRLNNSVPAGAVASVITVGAGSAGRVLAFATPLDAISGDTWVVTDWPRVDGFAATERQVIPVAGRVIGANANFFRTSMSILNQGSSTANITARFVANTGAVTSKSVSLGARTTRSWEDVVGELFAIENGLGFIEIDPAGAPLSVTSRTAATIGDDPRSFGTGVPAVAANAMTAGEITRISGFDDADAEVITARTPATFRTNLGLVETSGNAATVRITLHYRHQQSTTLTEIGSATRDINLGPKQFLLLQNVSRQVLGDYRNSLQGNLKNLFLEIEVIGGTGSVVAFTSSVDNGTADQIFKLE